MYIVLYKYFIIIFFFIIILSLLNYLYIKSYSTKSLILSMFCNCLYSVAISICVEGPHEPTAAELFLTCSPNKISLHEGSEGYRLWRDINVVVRDSNFSDASRRRGKTIFLVWCPISHSTLGSWLLLVALWIYNLGPRNFRQWNICLTTLLPRIKSSWALPPLSVHQNSNVSFKRNRSRCWQTKLLITDFNLSSSKLEWRLTFSKMWIANFHSPCGNFRLVSLICKRVAFIVANLYKIPSFKKWNMQN